MALEELPLIVRKPIWNYVIVISGAAIGAACLLLLPDIYSDPRRFAVAFVLCMIAGCGLLILAQRKPDLVISADGMQALDWGEALVRWDEIDRAFVIRRKGIDYLCLALRDAGAFQTRSGHLTRLVMTATRAEGLGDLMFKPRPLRLDTPETLQLIELLVNWHKSASKPPASAVRYRTN